MKNLIKRISLKKRQTLQKDFPKNPVLLLMNTTCLEVLVHSYRYYLFWVSDSSMASYYSIYYYLPHSN